MVGCFVQFDGHQELWSSGFWPTSRIKSKEQVGWPGLEPGTNGLKGRCSTD